MEWKDETSYRQGDTDRTPKTWVLGVAGLRIVVSRHIHFAPDEWVLTCEPWFNKKVISNGTEGEAKEAALSAVRNCVATALFVLPPDEKHAL